MAESMKGLHRSHRCTEVSSANIGEKVTVMGWVQKRRNLGSLIFIDLRDRSGLLQIVFDEESVGAEGFAKAGTLRSEYVVAVEGTVQKRSAAVNENLKTGDIEVIARLSCAKPCASGKFLCTATVSAAVQAASDGIRL